MTISVVWKVNVFQSNADVEVKKGGCIAGEGMLKTGSIR